MLDKPLSNRAFAAKVMPDIWRILKSNMTSEFFHAFTGGPFVRKFEKEFARYVGTKYAVSVCNGTLALNAAYTALNICQKKRAITTPYSFVATSAELVRAELTPTFVDVRMDNASLDPASVEDEMQFQSQWPDSIPKILVPMHPLGSPSYMGALMKIAKQYNLAVIEDAAQALSPTYELHGFAACFSFQSTKSMSTGGEGGMVVTNDREFYDKLCYVRNQGIKYGPFKQKYAPMMATNYRLTEIGASIGLTALKGYGNVVRHQLMLGEILKEGMVNSAWLIPQEPWSANGYIFAGRIRGCASGVSGVWQCYTPNVGHAQALKTRTRFLKKIKRWNRGVPGKVIGGGYSELIYELPAFRGKIDWAKGGCPVAEMWRDHAVWFDIRRWSVEEVKNIARAVEKFKP